MNLEKSYLLICSFFLLLSGISFAQIEGMTYQATILNSSNIQGGENNNTSFSNKAICLKFSILGMNKNILFQEVVTTKTDDYGIINVLVGSGSVTNNSRFKKIDEVESNNEVKFFRVEVCFNAYCDNFELLNEQPLNQQNTKSNSEGELFVNNSNVGNQQIITLTDSQILSIENGGTGSSTQNFVDLTTNQTIKGDKVFSDHTSFDNDIKVRGIKFGFGSGNLPTNTIIGSNALDNNISGQYNTALGFYALSANLSSFNTALGHYSLASNTTGSGNTALGSQTLFKNQTGGRNLAIGLQTLKNNTTGEYNTALGGTDALFGNLSGSYNTAVGSTSLYSNESGSYNFAMGLNSLYNNLSGNYNIAIGINAGYRNTKNNNIYLGTNAGYNNENGDSNLFLGNSAGINTTGSRNILIGNIISSSNQNDKLNIGGIINGDLLNGNVNISGNLTASNLSGSNTGDQDISIKENLANKSTDGTLTSNSDVKYPSEKAVKTYVDTNIATQVPDASVTQKGKIQLAGDLSGTADSPTVPGLLTKEPIIVAGTATDYYRGDKTFQPLNKTAVGLGNADNTSDTNKPISQATSDALLLKEDLANKTTDGTLATNSDINYPSEKAVKTYVDTNIATQVPDASITQKGKIQLAGDLSGTANLPTIKNDAVTTSKIKNANVTDEKIVSIAASKITGSLAIENGGTGSATKNFVDLTTNQTIKGNKVFSDHSSFDNDIKVRGIKFGFGSGNLPTNTIIGSNALDNNISGQYNTALGFYALSANLSSFNTALGHYSLASNTTGSGNTALGSQALFKNQTGGRNLAIGLQTLKNNITGEYNTALGGTNALFANISGSFNTAVGSTSLYSNESGSYNFAMGLNSLYNNLSGNYNIAIGVNAGYRNTKNNNIYLGTNAGYNNENGDSNLFLGNSAGINTTGSRNILIGNIISSSNQNDKLNIGGIINGDLLNGNVNISGNLTASNLSGSNTGDQDISIKENLANKSTDGTLTSNSDVKYPSEKAVKTYVDNSLATQVPDASVTQKGKIQLAGDLSGTADSPTVPGLLTKEPIIVSGTATDYYRGDKTFQPLNKTAVGLGNADNTSDTNKPISQATSDALLLKEDLANKTTDGTLATNSDINYPSEKAVKTYVDTNIATQVPDASITQKGKIQLAGDLSGTADSPTVPGLLTKEPVIVAGTATDYYRGDKTFQPLNKTAVGLGNADNTSDSNKPISQATSDALLLKEDLANKTTDGTLATNSDINYPSEKAVKTYVDTNIATQVPDASITQKGKIQLAGDLSGTAAMPTISNDAITTIKIKDANVTDEKIFSIAASKITGSLAIENGGTGSATKNFVDLTTNQTIAGQKLFNGATSFGSDVKVREIKFGYGSGNLNTNTVIGIGAFNKNVSGEYNTALGFNALAENLSSFNTALGHYTLISNTTGYANTAIGAQALFLNQTGRYNLGVGVESLARNTTGENNTSIGGYDTMLNNTTGSDNSALGYASMYTNTTGGGNVALGINTLYENLTGNNNIAIGPSAGYHSTGDANIYIGGASGFNNNAGNQNIYIGRIAGANSTGSKNIIIGDNITNDIPSANNQLNIGGIIKGDLVTGDVRISGNITANNLPSTNKPVYFDFDNTNQTTSNLQYESTTLQVTIAEAGDYIIDFSGSYQNDTAGSKNSIAVFIDDNLVQNSERSDSFVNADDVRSVSTKTFLTSLIVGQIIEIKFKTTNGTALLLSTTLVATKR